MGRLFHFLAPILLTHGAGSDRNAPLLAALEPLLSPYASKILRYDLPFRQARPHGPPRPGDAAADRAGLRDTLRDLNDGALPIAAGHSYGGRQLSMLAAEEPGLMAGLMLLSYPLHPPRAPQQLRTSHFPALRTPVLFVHGARDPFGSIDEMRSAMEAIPARKHLVIIERAGHDLKNAAPVIAAAFRDFFAA